MACRIGSPGSGSTGLCLFLIGVAEIGIGIVVDIVVDPDPVLVPIRGRRCGQNQVVAHIAWLLCRRKVAQQLGADSIRGVTRNVRQNVALDRVPDVSGLCGRQVRAVGVGHRVISIRLASGNGVAAARIVNLTVIDGSAETVVGHRRG